MFWHTEGHRTEHMGWLRAAVLGANDGLISTSSLVVGVAASNPAHSAIVLAGVAGLVAGALSMAAGEYVSVSSQSDIERADFAREKKELATQPDAELDELTTIYTKRGLSPDLARQVAQQLTAHDALGAHVRDELGYHDLTRARPLQAAFASAGAFAIGATPPLLVTTFVRNGALIAAVLASTLVLLVLLGSVAARIGGAPMLPGAARVTFWGAVAMGCTALVGRFFGAVA